MNETSSLHRLAMIQHWLQHRIVSRASGEADEISQVIRSDARASAADRLAIYQQAFFARLLGVMEEEFPATLKVCGDDLFQTFVTDFLSEFPPSSDTLADLGHSFPVFLEQQRPPRDEGSPDWADLLIDVARWERLLTEVFDGPGLEGHLATTWVDGVSPDDLLRARFIFSPCVRLFTSRFPVASYVRAIRRGEPGTEPLPADQWLVVDRRNFTVHHTVVERDEFLLLQRLSGEKKGEPGSTLEQALGVVDGNNPDHSPSLPTWLYRWAANRWVVGVQLDDSASGEEQA